MNSYQYRSSEWDILEAMHRYGGGFVKQLAVLYRLGDSDNRRKLESQFQNYFEQYDELAYRASEKAKP